MGNVVCDVEIDKIALKNWVDAQVSKRKEIMALAHFGSQVEVISDDDAEVFLIEGIEILADFLGKKLIFDGKRSGYYRYHFVYEDVEFYQLFSKRMVCYENV